MTTKNLKDAKHCSAAKRPPKLLVKGYADQRGQRWYEVRLGREKALLHQGELIERAKIFHVLKDRGVTIWRPDDKKEVLEKLEELDHFPTRLIFDRPGWAGGQFANASGRVYAPGGTRKGLVAFQTSPHKCATKGKHAEWLKQVAEPLCGHLIPMFFVMAAFAAPMLEMSGLSANPGFELAGEGGKGKTTTMRLMASTSGPAMLGHQGYITTFSMTPAAIEQSMRMHSDMPFLIDEANLYNQGGSAASNRRMMQDFSFAMAQGTTKGRYNEIDQKRYWFICVTSANAPLHELMAQSHQDIAGAAIDRLNTIMVPAGDAGVFGPLAAGYENYRQFTQALEAGMAEQYGTAMSKYLRKLVAARHEDEAGLKAKIKSRIDAFKVAVGISDSNGSDVRVAEAYGLVYAAGVFARHCGVLPKGFDCMAAAQHCYANFRATVPLRQSLADRLRAIAARPETMTIDRRNLPTLTDDQMQAAGAFLRKIKGQQSLLLTAEFGRTMFPDWNALKGTSEFRNLNRSGSDDRGRGRHCRVRANKAMDWLYCFAMPE
ncbi:hypothetical protein GGR39_003245 [Novosphingobium fluoreni]|uniref:DUF927 domain-containing protein n=1 Tax=Novosphingobium fluoreni TaxID=1391222 RepID=A0A7W6FZY2_9SPHN|nr:DUF927 domain-containing protein [Novosphingobium fluoreni]MBB3941565.1 hypothetical protein [Novosphingobium fluoreni]